MTDIENKCITTADYNKFNEDSIDNKIKSKRLVDKLAPSGFISDLDKSVATLAPEAESGAKLIVKQNKIITKLQAFCWSYFRDKNHFADNGTQNYLIYQPMYRYFKKIDNTEPISLSKPNVSDNFLAPALSYIGNKTRVKFDGSCLKQDKITFTHGKIVNICIQCLWNKDFWF